MQPCPGAPEHSCKTPERFPFFSSVLVLPVHSFIHSPNSCLLNTPYSDCVLRILPSVPSFEHRRPHPRPLGPATPGPVGSANACLPFPSQAVQLPPQESPTCSGGGPPITRKG